jgi:hypothetical protein
MLVAVDKFTKWIEAAPVTTQDSTAAINFIKSIVFRFGVPHSIITDNGTNFTSKEFKSYCEGLNQIEICICRASKVKWPSRESQWLNMQWDKEKAASATRKSQARLGG